MNLTYPEGHIDEIRHALKTNEPDAAADAALFLLAAFLVDVRRIADALALVADNSAHAVTILAQNR